MRFRNRLPPPTSLSHSAKPTKRIIPPSSFLHPLPAAEATQKKTWESQKKVSFLTLPSVPPFSSQSLIKPPRRNSNLTGGEGAEEEGSLEKEESSSAGVGRRDSPVA